MSFNKRISKLIELEKITRLQFEKSIDVSENYSYKIKNPTLDLIDTILNVYPKINPDWLVFGIGEPYKTQSGLNIVSEPVAPYNTVDPLSNELIAKLESSEIIIKSLIERIKTLEEEAESLRQKKYGYRNNLTSKQFNSHHNKGSTDNDTTRFTPE